MEETRKALEEFFDKMLGSIQYFKKKSYENFFKETYEEYRGMIMALPGLCDEEEDGGQALEELASVIPAYVKEKSRDMSKKQRSRAGMDYNLTMAVYVVPMLCYPRDPVNARLAGRMVELWNETQVTDYTLQKSGFDQIAGGFRKKLLGIF